MLDSQYNLTLAGLQGIASGAIIMESYKGTLRLPSQGVMTVRLNLYSSCEKCNCEFRHQLLIIGF